LSGVRGNFSGGGVELELKKISLWRWSGVEVKTSGGGGRNFEFRYSTKECPSKNIFPVK
jgi:hypothetical protein